MSRSLSALFALFLAVGLAACGDDNSTASGGASAAKRTGPATQTVEIRGSAYVPEIVTVKVGQTVKWVNRDNMKHSATRDAADPKFDTALLVKDQESAPITFTKESDAAGWQYRCTVKGHEEMKGFVVVTK